MLQIIYIYIEYVMTKEEIINYIKNVNPLRIERFIEGYKLTDEEITIILKENPNNYRLIEAINYYQDKNKFVYTRR